MHNAGKNLKEMDTFPDRDNLPKLKEVANNLNKSHNKYWCWSNNKRSPIQKKCPWIEGFTVETCQTFKEKLMPMYLELVHKKKKVKGTVNRTNGQTTDWGNIFTNPISSRTIIQNIYKKNLKKLTSKKPNNPVKNEIQN